MVDTVKLCSPPISEALASAIEGQLCEVRKSDLRTGEVLWEFTSQSLAGSWDSRIRCAVERVQWVSDVPAWWVAQHPGEKARAQLIPCAPFVVLEGSVHKAMMGHNICGGPVNFEGACRWFVEETGRRLEVPLPDGRGWEVRRADWAEVFDLLTEAAVRDWMDTLTKADWPRRTIGRWGSEAVYMPGRASTCKFYAKGKEFRVHSRNTRPPLKDVVGPVRYGEWEELAQGKLRAETETKRRLVTDREREGLKGWPKVEEVSESYLSEVHESHVGKLLKEVGSGRDFVRTVEEVKARLVEVFGEGYSRVLLGTWHEFVTRGEEKVKRSMPKASFYRHRSDLVKAGCLWHNTDVFCITRTTYPADFLPVLGDPRRLVTVSEEVMRALESLERVA